MTSPIIGIIRHCSYCLIHRLASMRYLDNLLKLFLLVSLFVIRQYCTYLMKLFEDWMRGKTFTQCYQTGNAQQMETIAISIISLFRKHNQGLEMLRSQTQTCLTPEYMLLTTKHPVSLVCMQMNQCRNVLSPSSCLLHLIYPESRKSFLVVCLRTCVSSVSLLWRSVL